jgi:hypothetical protein
MKLIVVRILPLLCFLFPFNPKHFSDHLILEHPRPIFIPKYERLGFTLMSNNSQIMVVLISLFWIINRKINSKKCLKFNVILISL